MDEDEGQSEDKNVDGKWCQRERMGEDKNGDVTQEVVLTDI